MRIIDILFVAIGVFTAVVFGTCIFFIIMMVDEGGSLIWVIVGFIAFSFFIFSVFHFIDSGSKDEDDLI